MCMGVNFNCVSNLTRNRTNSGSQDTVALENFNSEWGQRNKRVSIGPNDLLRNLDVDHSRPAAGYFLSVSKNVVNKDIEKLLRSITSYISKPTAKTQFKLCDQLEKYKPEIPFFHRPQECFIAPGTSYCIVRRAKTEEMGISYNMRHSAHELLAQIDENKLVSDSIPVNIQRLTTAFICKNAHVFMPISVDNTYLTQKFIQCIFDKKIPDIQYIDYISNCEFEYNTKSYFVNKINQHYNGSSRERQPISLLEVTLYEYLHFLPANDRIPENDRSSQQAFASFIYRVMHDGHDASLAAEDIGTGNNGQRASLAAEDIESDNNAQRASLAAEDIGTGNHGQEDIESDNNAQRTSLATREAYTVFMSGERQPEAAESGIFGRLRNASSNLLGSLLRREYEPNEAARENYQGIVIQGEIIPVEATAIPTATPIPTIFPHVDGVPYNPVDGVPYSPYDTI